jgi:predicted TIM-barrel fold metal-dependent hydrolase
MSDITYPIDPTALGLPTLEELRDLRIWDPHYHGIDRHEEIITYVERMGIERVVSLDIGESVGDDLRNPELAQRHRRLLDEHRDHLAGIVRIDPGRPEESLDRINRWVADGPCIGIKYAGGNPSGLTCSHPNNDIFIPRAIELGAYIYIHASYEVDFDEPRYPGSGVSSGESTPDDVVELAGRYPETIFVLGHAGADWELGIRAVRGYDNIFVEFAGMPPNSGMMDMAMHYVGEDRIIWAGHASSRSHANDLSKAFDGDLSDAQLEKVLGRNVRQLMVPIMQEKGYDVTV